MRTNPPSHRLPCGMILLLGLLLQGCSSDSDSPFYPAGPTTVGGNVSKGPIVGATVAVTYITDLNGLPGTATAGPFTTDSSGNWTGELPVGSVGPYLLTATGGTYDDESTGSPVTLLAGQTLYGLLKGTSSQVTPLTTTTLIGASFLANTGATVADAIAAATASSVTAFGFDFATTVPRNSATASSSEKQYAALLGGLSTLIDDNPALSAFSGAHKMDLILGLSRDMADGRLDGFDPSGSPIDVPTSGPGTLAAPLPPLSEDDLSAWLAASNTYAASEANLTGITFNTSLVWAAAGSTGSGNCEVTFSGPGLALLPEACFDVTSTQVFKEQYRWFDGPDGAQILAIPVDPSSNLYRTIYVNGPEHLAGVWSVFNASGIPGASRTGGVVTLTNVVLEEVTTEGMSLTLNGQLDEPISSAPAP